MLRVAELLLEGIYFIGDKGTPVRASIDNLEAADVNLGIVHILCGKVIQENYGELLKKDLMGSLTGLLGNSLAENPNSTSK